MKNSALNKYKFLLISTLIIIMSLSCDDQEATPVETPTLDYSITINSEVRNCNNVGCLQECIGVSGCSSFTSFTECEGSQLDCNWTTISNEAYNANVENINSNYDGYYLFFQIQLKDIDGAPVENAEISFIVDWEDNLSESVNANFMKFNDLTDAAGRIEGYWADAGQVGDFILSAKFTDANSTAYTSNYPVSIHPTSDVVTSVELEVAQIEMIIEGGTETNTIKARVKNAADQQLENVDVVFEITDGTGSLSNTISSTECNIITNEDNEEFCDTYASVSYFSESGIDEDIIYIKAYVETPSQNVEDNVVFSLASQATPMELFVHSMQTDFSPDPLIMPIDSTDAVYTVSLTASLKDINGGVVDNATVNFEYILADGEIPVGALTSPVVESNADGKAIANIIVNENEVNFKETISIRAYIADPTSPETLLFDNSTSVDLYTDEYFDLENSVLSVEYLLNNITPNPLILLTEDDIVDSTYTIEVAATVKDENGISISGVPINFQSNNPLVGTLLINNPESDSSGTVIAEIKVLENEVSTKESIEINAFITDPQDGGVLFSQSNTVDIYTDTYYQIEAAQELNVWSENDEEINDNTSITYVTDLYAEVLNQYGAKMPNMPVLFSKLTQGIGSLNNSVAYTDSIGNAASVVFTLNPDALDNFPSDTTVTVDFNVSLYGDNLDTELNNDFSINYQINGNSEPEYNVTDFQFYPDVDVISHSLYNQTEISVIAKNEAGVGISNVLVRFSLDENSRSSFGELSAGEVYTCCDTNSEETIDEDTGGEETGGGTEAEQGQNGVASVTYTNIQGGSDILTAYILDPETAEILTDENGNQIGVDNIQILINDACPNCEEELTLLSEHYELPATNSNTEQTNIYAFYTDSLGAPPEVNSFINLQPWQQNEEGDWVNVGSVSPENAFFVNGTVSDLDGVLPNAPSDSSIVYASAVFNMENASGLVKVVGSYLTLSDTLGVQINSTGASFVEIIPPYPSTIAVQGSPDQESTIITAEIRDGNGNLVSQSYITRFTLAVPAVLAGVHFDGEVGTTDTYTLSSNGQSTITLNSGQTPVSVAMTVEIYELADISSVNELDDLDIIAEASAVPVTVASGPPSSGIIGYSFLEAINIGGGLTELPISIMLWDAWSNPVADSISVYFTLNPVTAGSVIPEAKTANLKPNGSEQDSWPGVAWTTIQYNASQLFEFPEVIATTTGNMCYDLNSQEFDPTISYELCTGDNLDWQTEVMITYSSLDNIVSYQNVCVDCSLSLVPLSDTQWDFECSPGEFTLDLRAQLLDFYGVPVEGAIVELLVFGSQGGPTIEAYEYVCYWDTNSNGEAEGNELQFDDDGNPLSQQECDAVNLFTWGAGPMVPEPPSTNVLTDEFGLKYWRVTFTDAECTLTSTNPDSYTCSSPTIEANLVNPNGATSEEQSITINSTCVE